MNFGLDNLESLTVFSKGMAPLLGILKPQLPVITLQTPNHRLRQVEMKAYRLPPSPKQYIISLGCLSRRLLSQDTCMCMGGVSIYQPLSLVWTSTIYTCTPCSISGFLSHTLTTSTSAKGTSKKLLVCKAFATVSADSHIIHPFKSIRTFTNHVCPIQMTFTQKAKNINTSEFRIISLNMNSFLDSVFADNLPIASDLCEWSNHLALL